MADRVRIEIGFDGGAHVALFSTFAECSGKYRSIAAIEASPATAAYIRAFKERNDLHFALHECALGEGEGRLTFEIPDTGYLMPSHSALSVSELYREQKKRKIEVASRPLTDFLEAGHTLVAHTLPGADPVHKVTIVPRGRALGVTWQLPERDRISLYKDQMLNEIAILFGGRIAEDLFVHRISTGASAANQSCQSSRGWNGATNRGRSSTASGW